MVLVIAAATALSCGAANSRRTGQPVTRRARHAPAWVLATTAPGHCARGFRRPTIAVQDAVDWAEEDARRNLAEELLGVRLKDVEVMRNDDTTDVSLQQVDGDLGDVVVAAKWVDRGGVIGEAGTAYAMACRRDAVPTSALDASRGVPAWVLNLPAGRTCAIGICGATLRPETQESCVLDDARDRLAKSLAIRLRAAVAEGISGPSAASVETVPDHARGQAEQATVRERWLDRDGIGPIQDPDTLYVLVCLDPGLNAAVTAP